MTTQPATTQPDVRAAVPGRGWRPAVRGEAAWWEGAALLAVAVVAGLVRRAPSRPEMIMAPQAIEGVATVLVLYRAVQRLAAPPPA